MALDDRQILYGAAVAMILCYIAVVVVVFAPEDGK